VKEFQGELRDYRFNRDIHVRIFDDRVEVESPGVLPGNLEPRTIAKAGSVARNPLVAANLREFPVAPNIDAGEGVKMMFKEMQAAELYPPQYVENRETGIETLTVTLFNAARPSDWDQVSELLDQKGSIANADLVRIAGLDTLKASRRLNEWKEQGLLVPVPGRGKRNMAYTRPGATAEVSSDSVAESEKGRS
jgi:ATP-dependent DNA helicase RecG